MSSTASSSLLKLAKHPMDVVCSAVSGLNVTFLLNCHSTGLSLVLFRAVTVLEWSRSLQDPFLDVAW